jgi:hypothetical protein
MIKPCTDPWADLADDIRRVGEKAEGWQASATKAEARMADLEAAIGEALKFFDADMLDAGEAILRAALDNPTGEPDHV